MPVSIPKLSICAFLCFATAAQAADWNLQRLRSFAADTCRGWEATQAPSEGYANGPIDASDLRFGQRVVGERFRLPVDNNALVELDVVMRGGKPARFVASWFNEFGDPKALVSLALDCSLQAARQLEYSAQGQALYITTLDDQLQRVGEPEWLNPPLVFIERPVPHQQPDGAAPVRVALVDSGVNYQLPEINRRLARDADGHLVGYDFWEMDQLPFDSHPVNNGFFVQRHGTRSASLLLQEAPQAELVPYRYPRPDMSRMHALVQHASEHGVAIVGMPLGSNHAEDWGSFAQAAREYPHILFIASAGNNGRDIDSQPVFPAALDLDNLLVVSSAGDFVVPAQGVNWGRRSVDYLVPAERRPALDFSGRPARVSGSSYAVSRVAALAARIKAEQPDWGAAQIIAEFQRRYGADSPDVYGWVRRGYIADPLAGGRVGKAALPGVDSPAEIGPVAYRLDLEVLRLDPAWTPAQIEQALHEAYRILAQCDIGAGRLQVYDIDSDDYLRDLATGSARTLLEAVDPGRPAVVFARDTRMQEAYLGEAFGTGNTRLRPWLAQTVWLMRGVDDAGIALAHELFHVLANSGEHVNDRPNLMQAYTRPESTALDPGQCARAQDVGQTHGLLRPR